MNQISTGPRVLVFDSGVGGLSIVEAIDDLLSEWQLIYLADNAFFPYGDQPEEVVVERCVELITTTLAVHSADLIVIGCNTASTVVLPALRARFSCPVIGVVPAIKPAALQSHNRRIGLLATPATVRRPYLESLISEFALDCTITRVGSSELVRLAENWMATTTIDPRVLARILDPLQEAGVDTVVLGCTHFPLIRPLLESVLGAGVNWVDSGSAIARRIQYLWAGMVRTGSRGITDKGLLADPREGLFFFTGREPAGVRAYLALHGWLRPEICSDFPEARLRMLQGFIAGGSV